MIHRNATKAAVFLSLMLICLTVSAALLEAASRRTVTYRYFDEALPPDPAHVPTIDWREPRQHLDRPFRDAEKALLGRRLDEAWTAHAIALDTGRTDHLADHFSGPALRRAAASAQVAGARMAVLDQVVTPDFHHADGSMAVLESDHLTARFLLDAAGDLAGFDLARDAVRTVAINETTGWRLFVHERHATTDAPVAAQAPAPLPRLAGVNYYPALTPWDRFWPGYDARVVAADLDRVRGLGGNAIRIFLQRGAFLDPATRDDHLARLAELLDMAKARGLWVVPTLFDLRGGYETRLWAHDHLYLETVLPVLAACGCTAYVDLKNEPDLDYAAHGRGQVQAWIMAMAGSTRRIAPGLRLTVGWSSADRAADLAALFEVISYHDYTDPEGTARRLAHVRSHVGGKPVHVTEIGASSWSLLAGFPGSPDTQADLIAERTAALAGADGLFVWTLHDFPDPDPDHRVLGRSPWHRGLQSRFGLIAGDGAEKPAAATVRAAFHRLLKGPVQ